MRVALISDLHGNEVALQAVLRDIGQRGIDQVVCLGDVATLGPCPSQVIAILAERGYPCILGNHDAFMLDPTLISTYTDAPPVLAAVDWCRSRLTQAELSFLRSFSDRLELELAPDVKLLLFHGSPRSHMEDLLCTASPEKLDEALKGHHAQVMAGGHTHIQMLRQHRGILLVNPGSVGMPFQEYAAGGPPTLLPHAEYATIEAKDGTLQVSLRRVAVDKAALRAALANTTNPLRNMLLQQCS